MALAEKLYSPELLGLAVTLAEFPPAPDLPLHGSARSRSCGSTLDADLATDADCRIVRLGLKVRACAVGQAAAAIFAADAVGRTASEIEIAQRELGDWLAQRGPTPDWPGIAAIAPARDLVGRHGAIMLPWTAAVHALNSVSPAS